MEDVETEGESALNRKLVVIPSEDGRAGIVERLSNAAQAGKIDTYVWATPGLPMLIFITAGLIFALIGGDLVWMPSSIYPCLKNQEFQCKYSCRVLNKTQKQSK